MVLCNFCEGITIEKLADDAEVSGLENKEEPPGYSHHPSYPALLESAKTCELCRLISDIGENDGILPKFDPKFDMVPDQIALRNASQRLKLRAFRSAHDQSSGSKGLELSGVSLMNAQRLRVYLEIAADEDSAAARSGDIAGRTINENSASAHTFNVISLWMQTCRSSHTRCSHTTSTNQNLSKRRTETDLPTRVLYIGTSDSDNVQLFISNGAKGKYAALSHRWGNRETTACTTTKTIDSWTSIIPMDSLSQLFRDAIFVTRRLGFLYLWIDSLCILQDSREDWEREAASMGDVFGYSEVTISAVASEDGFSGFLGPRDNYMVPVSYRKSDTEPGEGLVYFRRQKNIFSDNILENALNKRAWVKQERILAQRVLSFAKSQIFWECREMLAFEGKSQTINPDFSGGSATRRLPNLLQQLSLGRNNPSLKAKIYTTWRDIVEDVSDAGLTYESDKLFTIQGISQRVQRETHSEYLYGTWADDLACELHWAPQPRDRKMSICRLPLVPRAPSWCWSSLEGPIRFWSADLDYSVCFERTVVNIDTDDASKLSQQGWALHLFALERACEVTIDGLIWNNDEPSLVAPDNDDWASATKVGLATLDATGRVVGGSKFDLLPTEDSLGSYSCLLLLEFPDSKYGIGLLLNAKSSPTDAPKTYVRVGTVCLSPRGISWLREIKPKPVTLV